MVRGAVGRTGIRGPDAGDRGLRPGSQRVLYRGLGRRNAGRALAQTAGLRTWASALPLRIGVLRRTDRVTGDADHGRQHPRPPVRALTGSAFTRRRAARPALHADAPRSPPPP